MSHPESVPGHYKKLLVVLCFGAMSSGAYAADETVAAVDEHKVELQQLSDRITELEVQNHLNKVQFSGQFITHYEGFRNTHDVPGEAPQLEKLNPLGMYVGINIDFDATERLKFYSTLGMSKFFNNEGRAENLGPANYATYQATETGGWGYDGSRPKFDKAFASYEFEKVPLTLALGRMPTNGGPPLNERTGEERNGTYPRFAFNAIFDGLAAVYDFSSMLPEHHSFKIRAFYQPFTNIDPHDRTLQFVDGARVMSNTFQGVLLAEYALSGLAFANRFSLMYMHAGWNQFYNGYTTPDPNNPDIPATSSHPAPAGTPAYGQTENGTDDCFYAGLENIGKIGLNLSWSGLLYRAVDSGAPDLKKSSFAHFVAINQMIPQLHRSILGVEFVKTQIFHYLDEWTRLNLIPFAILQNSTGYHIYWSLPLDKKIIGTVGFYHLNAGAGDVYQPQESKAYAWYAEIKMTF